MMADAAILGLMSDTPDAQPDDTTDDLVEELVDETDETDETDEEIELEAFDLDGDGKISPIEAERARLGVVDARLEEIAHEGGVKGHIADAAHKLIDKLDND